VSISDLASRLSFDLRLGELDRVDQEQHAVQLRDGDRLAYDALVIGTGAVARSPFPGAITFAASRTPPRSAKRWTTPSGSRSWRRRPRI
jgi:NADH dehydrogenase FAD-containing subunit